MSNTKIKFNFKDTDAMCAGVQVLVKAYRYYEGGCKQKIECVERAMRPYRTKYRLPGDEAMRDGLTDVIRQMGEGKPMEGSGEKNMARTWVVNEALKVLGIQEPEPEKEPEAEEQVQGQICMELPEMREEVPNKIQEEQLDLEPLKRLIAGKAEKNLKALEQLHEDIAKLHEVIAKMDDHMCQVMRRLVG